MIEEPGTVPGVPRAGRIITFYSYKGGTGRSMALANVAFILASQGKKVLVVDWDLEAPGLHRYFHPFLEDPELASSVGLIDYFFDVVAAASAADADGESEPWWKRWTSLLRYTYPLNVRLLGTDSSSAPGPGAIDFVPAGRQCADYGERVGGFDWKSFYQRLGGGVLLEAVKQRLRERYDYVLIDSRTGISDVAGICTVQMPDDLVVCFTLNRQSMFGAAAAARSAAEQRTKKGGTAGLRIWPVPMRIELAEKDRLDAARATAHDLFRDHIGPLLQRKEDRPVYWGAVEVLYRPYFAYEEVLSVFAEHRHQTGSMLASFEYLTRRLTNDEIGELRSISPRARQDILARYMPPNAAPSGGTNRRSVYLSYSRGTEQILELVREKLRQAGVPTWSDRDLLLGDNFGEVATKALAESSMMLAFIGVQGLTAGARRELDECVRMGKRVVPVLVEVVRWEDMPPAIRETRGIRLPLVPEESDIQNLVNEVSRVVDREAPPVVYDPEDPQKGRWGGVAVRDGRTLSAIVTELDGTWSEVRLSVRSTGPPPLQGQVLFHLHPTFRKADREVEVTDGRAELAFTAWGAFTVGAEADDGRTQLELDLSKDPTFPERFRAR